MAREEKAIFTNLCLIKDPQGRILVEDRTDPNWPGICLPGGHVEPEEAFTDSVIREVFEETGLHIRDPKLCGVKQFQTNNDSRYVVFFYQAEKYTGTLHSSDEGNVFWISREELEHRVTVPDLMDMIQVMESDQLNEFIYTKADGQWSKRLL